MNKYELHIHTSECDKVAECGGAEIVRLYREAGYSGLVITDHYFSLFYKWFEKELSGRDKKGIIERYLKGYYAARNEGEKTGLTVLCGAEVRFDNTVNDYLVYGLEEKDFYDLPLLNKLQSVEELIKVLPEYALAVQAHPFREGMTVCNPDLLFGIEGYNGGTESFRNEMAKTYAANFGKALTSGPDFHSKSHLAKGGIATKHKILTSSDLVKVLKDSDYTLIENGVLSV